jgi:hypothetical protein
MKINKKGDYLNFFGNMYEKIEKVFKFVIAVKFRQWKG